MPHEPYGGYMFFTAWSYDASSFNKLNEKDSALVLHEWHDAIIREYWQSLTPEDVEWVG